MRSATQAIGLGALALIACRGVGDSIHHAGPEVHRIDAEVYGGDAPVEALGDGCYEVAGRLYECSTDLEPAGGLSCIIDLHTSSGGALVNGVYRRRWIDGWPSSVIQEMGPSRRCAARYDARHGDRYTPTCAPLVIAAATGAADADDRRVPLAALALRGMPATLAPPMITRLEVMRSGVSRLRAELEVCVAPGGAVTPGAWQRTSGFGAIDRELRRVVGDLSSAARVDAPVCALLAIALTAPACQLPSAAL